MPTDQYPQWINLTKASTPSVNVFGQSETQVHNPDGHVMEILKVQVKTPKTDVAENATASKEGLWQITKASKTAIVNIDDPDVLQMNSKRTETVYAEATETGGGPMMHGKSIDEFDYAYGNKGFLVSATKLFFGVNQTGHGSAQTWYGRVLVRFVKVSATELIQLTQQ